ncbi:tRNA-dihydrouridine synthase [Blastococcus brunescens]|uniref:tRNA-dihydrouridine synthase n=1 Tax=Blastococcus brunescens TaxID=1564165 RepID=A0ABZ1B469_9ACTN|nr:tRNA-dihydrouridine synthase [Blastococcus sp. BMG 8361]WRL65595.1 tRNA-dihydrouridine synthase [Blastococcus sp. BMG 8361]
MTSTLEPATALPPLKLGALAVDPAVVLAPMAGITNPAFRTLCREFGAGLYVCEMITTRALVERNEKTLRMIRATADERTRSPSSSTASTRRPWAARSRCSSTRASPAPARRTSTSTSAARCPR